VIGSRTVARPLSLPLLVMISAFAACSEPDALSFEESAAQRGLAVHSKTFSAAFADVDDDGDDDLLVSRHGPPPALYRNRGDGSFELVEDAIAAGWSDHHGLTVFDADGDGDRDVILAGGGDDGVGKGWPSRVFRNLLAEQGTLGFADATAGSGLERDTRQRTRCFLPMLGPGGERIDLYQVGRARKGHPNRLYVNRSDSAILFEPAAAADLERSFDSECRDVVVDIDRDGDRDLLLVDRRRLLLLRRHGDRFRAEPIAAGSGRVSTLAVGDLDADGLPDVFLGTATRDAPTDRTAVTDDRIHIEVRSGRRDAVDELSFAAAEDPVHFDFLVKPALAQNDPAAIRIGRDGRMPGSRRFDVLREQALGMPTAPTAGLSIGFDPVTGRWRLVWRHARGRADPPHRGVVLAHGLSEVRRVQMESIDVPEVRDVILHNVGGSLREWPGPMPPPHDGQTAAAVIVDLDNDGEPEIVGSRRRQGDAFGGDLFVLRRRAAGDFAPVSVPGLADAGPPLYQADQLIWSDVDRDGLIDLFATNGWGLKPANGGPFRLYRNRSTGRNGFVAIDLRGAGANKDALGAQVTLQRVSGPQAVVIGYAELGTQFNRGQSSRVLHFGLGRSREPLQASIRWPSGRESRHALRRNQLNRIAERGER
jgi:hypothetical protein